MPAPQSLGNEEQRAALSQKRGNLASGIKDPTERRRFIARQGEDEAKGSKGVGMEKIAAETSLEEGRQTAGVDSSDTTRTLRSMKKGGKVTKTGAHYLHKGETVVPAGKSEDGERPQEVHIRPVKGGYHVKHLHKPAKRGDGSMALAPEPSEFVVPDTASLHDHLDQHLGDSDALTEQ